MVGRSHLLYSQRPYRCLQLSFISSFFFCGGKFFWIVWTGKKLVHYLHFCKDATTQEGKGTSVLTLSHRPVMTWYFLQLGMTFMTRWANIRARTMSSTLLHCKGLCWYPVGTTACKSPMWSGLLPVCAVSAWWALSNVELNACEAATIWRLSIISSLLCIALLK